MRFPTLLGALLCFGATASAAETPNVILIYADDLGYGDVSCYGATAVQTPNIDRLAKEGLKFTDGHSSAATCTPSRYSLLTGEYAWRKKGTGVLPGDAELIIKPGRKTLPDIFRAGGYRTGVVGKWHLGLGEGPVDWNADIKPGPMEIGFDSSFIMAATGDRTPCVYLDGHKVAGLDQKDPIRVSYKEPFPGVPTGKANPELLKVHPSHGHDMAIVNGISRIGWMTGGASALWKDEDMADVFTKKAVEFIEKSEAAKKPFFLFFALHDIHVPRVPHPRFVGKTAMGPRGDAIVQTDWSVGEVLAALERLKIADNTLVIFSSDNGPVIDDGYKDEAVAKLGAHKPAGPLRGGKYTPFEAGTRVAFLARWPGKIKPGVSDALICQIDFPATFAALTEQTLGAEDAPDSENVLAALLGTSSKGREQLVEQAGPLALRQGLWKYIAPAAAQNARAGQTAESADKSVRGQLYNLAVDLAEANNLLTKEPDRARAMADELKRIREAGRTRKP